MTFENWFLKNKYSSVVARHEIPYFLNYLFTIDNLSVTMNFDRVSSIVFDYTIILGIKNRFTFGVTLVAFEISFSCARNLLY